MKARLALATALLLAPVAGLSQPNAERGAKLHESCLSCHGTEVYRPPKAKVKSLSALRAEVRRWSVGYYNPPRSPQDIDDLVAWLNREFYKFPEK